VANIACLSSWCRIRHLAPLQLSKFRFCSIKIISGCIDQNSSGLGVAQGGGKGSGSFCNVWIVDIRSGKAKT